jgi:anti-sigma B factor antagonist
MDLQTKSNGEIAVVSILDDTLDATNVPDFREDIAPAIRDSRWIVLDMSALRFVDSSGCGALLSCLRHLNQKGGDLLLCGVQKPVLTLFELVRMHRIVEIFDTQDKALSSLGV